MVQVDRLTKVLKSYDRSLYAHRNPHGVVMVMRQADRLDASDYNQSETDTFLVNPQLIFSLTADWTLKTESIDIGIEPVMARLREIDMWRCDDWIHDRKKARIREEEDKKRQRENEFRAKANDMQPYLARALNDINTSSLDMTDPRKKQELRIKELKYGNRK